MGDRGNVQVKDNYSKGDGVFLYTHWSGSELPQTVANALARSKDRWDDTPYLTRVIFCEMVKGEEDGTTGYGIDTQEMDPNHDLISVDTSVQLVKIGREKTYTFYEFVAKYAGDKVN